MRELRVRAEERQALAGLAGVHYALGEYADAITR